MLIETKNVLQIMSINWYFINFIFFISENFQRIQSKVFKVKTFLIYLQLWIWNFAHFFSYKKIKKKRCFFIHPSLLSATRALRRPGDATSFWGWRRGDTYDTSRMHVDDDEKGRIGNALIVSKRLRGQFENSCDLKYLKRQQKHFSRLAHLQLYQHHTFFASSKIRNIKKVKSIWYPWHD